MYDNYNIGRHFKRLVGFLIAKTKNKNRRHTTNNRKKTQHTLNIGLGIFLFVFYYDKKTFYIYTGGTWLNNLPVYTSIVVCKLYLLSSRDSH